MSKKFGGSRKVPIFAARLRKRGSKLSADGYENG